MRTPSGADEVASAYKRIARVYFLLGDLDKSLEFYGRGSPLLEQLLAESPENPEYRHLLGVVYFERSFVLHGKGKIPDALALRQRSLDLLETLADEHPDVAEFRRARVHVCNRMGMVLQSSNRPQEAEKAQRRGLALAKQLVTDFPKEARFPEEVGFCCLDLGNLLIETNPEESEKTLEQGLRVWEELSAREPWDPAFREHIGYTVDALAGLRTRAGHYREAIRLHCRALGLYQKLAADFPERPHFQSLRNASFNSLTNLAIQEARQAKDHLVLVQEAGEILGIPGAFPGCLEAVGRMLVRCAELAKNDSRLGYDQRQAYVQAYSEQAVGFVLSVFRQPASLWDKEAANAGRQVMGSVDCARLPSVGSTLGNHLWN